MKYITVSLLVLFVVGIMIPNAFAETVPAWVKNTAGWWADGQIDNSVFLQVIEFLINEEIITVQIPVVESGDVEEVPVWVKNTAGWWAEDKIHDFTFVGAIEYLIAQGIMTVNEKQEAEVLPPCPHKIISGYICIVEEVVEVKDFYMEVNGDNCCSNWGHVGEKYRFQIETSDEYRGNPIDGVTITAKIISKDGELRYDFGQVTTVDGIYKNSITIPSMDWYAGNILFVTGEYNGVEKTIEKEFEVFAKNNKTRVCVKISCYVINSVGSVSDGTNLNAVRGVETVTIGGSTYVIAAAQLSDSIEIINISTPSSPTSVARLGDGGTPNRELDGPVELDIATIGGKPYAVVAAYNDDGIDIIDISDPTNPTSVGRATHDSDYKELVNPYDVAIATIGGSTYAVVTAYTDNGVQIIDISDPTSPSATAIFSDTGGNNRCLEDNDRCLRGPVDVEIATIGSSTYAVVAGSIDDGIEIIDISTPSSPSEAGRLTDRDDSTRELDGANGVAIATIGGSTYAVVAGNIDDGISIIDISTPSSPVYVSELEDGTDTGVCTAANGERCLDGPRDVEVETIRGLTYAIVASHEDDAITIIDITNVSNPSIVASMYNSSTKELDEAKGVSIVTIGGSTYVVVGSATDDGIEIIRIMD